MTVKKDYRTSDLYLAAFLKAKGVPFEGSVRFAGKVHFIFDDQEVDIKDLKTQFFSRSGSVSALDYADELRALKSICHS